MAKRKHNKKSSRKKGKHPGIIRTLREGRPLSIELFRRHGWFILIALVIVIALIGQRYSNQTKMEEIKKLNKELALKQSIQINEKAKYMTLIRENRMRQLLRDRHLDLEFPEQPPYVIPKN